jgi:hypothetical protein
MNMLDCLRGTGFRKATALAACVLALSSTQPLAAAGMPGPGHPAVAAPVFGEFRALSYLQADSRHLMVHLDNPREERVTVLVLNGHQEVVYRKTFGRPTTFVGRFSLTGLPNGEYTFVVKGARHSHVRSISVETESARVLRVL